MESEEKLFDHRCSYEKEQIRKIQTPTQNETKWTTESNLRPEGKKKKKPKEKTLQRKNERWLERENIIFSRNE